MKELDSKWMLDTKASNKDVTVWKYCGSGALTSFISITIYETTEESRYRIIFGDVLEYFGGSGTVEEAQGEVLKVAKEEVARFFDNYLGEQ